MENMPCPSATRLDNKSRNKQHICDVLYMTFYHSLEVITQAANNERLKTSSFYAQRLNVLAVLRFKVSHSLCTDPAESRSIFPDKKIKLRRESQDRA